MFKGSLLAAHDIHDVQILFQTAAAPHHCVGLSFSTLFQSAFDSVWVLSGLWTLDNFIHNS